MTGERLLSGRYEVRQLLGRGGMAEVHAGVDTRLGRRVAIKLLRSDLARDPSFHERLKREAQSAAGLNHPGIVAVYDSGEETLVESGGSEVQVPFIVMEYVEGQTLRQVLNEHGHLTISEALDVTAGVLAPLDYSHRNGIVHRDIKPGNVMLTPEGDIKVMDFGIARALEDTGSLTGTQSVLGTAQYLSPEQARGELVDARSDLYSTACLLYELLTGRPPFKGDSQLAVAYQHVGEAPQPPSAFNPEIPEHVDRLVLHALEKDRDHRYQDAYTFREDVLAARDGRPMTIDVPGQTSDTGYAAGAAGAAAGFAAGDAATQVFNQTQAYGSQGDPYGSQGQQYGSQGQPYGSQGQPYGSAPSTQYMPQAAESVGSAGPYDPNQPGQFATVGTGYAQQVHPETSGMSTLPNREEDYASSRRKRGWMWGLAAVLVIVLAGLGGWVYVMTKGPEPFALENLKSKSTAEAKQYLQDNGLNSQTKETHDDKVDEGDIVKTDPTAGTEVTAGQTVTLYVSTGPDVVDVPDVAGDTESLARQRLTDAGLKAGANEEKTSPDKEKGTVLSTNPKKGKEVKRQSTVDLVISNGKVDVPSVTGQKQEEACETLRGKKYQLECSVKVVETEDHKAGEVYEQSVNGGNTVDQHSTITITVAKAKPKPTPPPTPSQAPIPTTGILPGTTQHGPGSGGWWTGNR
ncbi:Stk1 family PASTA domain-containing Ser/Thr kinase [Brevibacterium moorei]|uniref:Stk1 family PASTA domain-containing Ser/Thr kinase n=1 Tax=Brevibacterium moorei TaxID=2968457 RepID=UPI00211B8C7E|nr:Stk1 family PASTA domain-containing Ser/Thr kinase [Brevibacterium sp. 68QC2CO]